MIILEVLGILVGLIVLYFLIVVFSPFIKVKKLSIPISKNITETIPECRKNINFTVDGSLIDGWFYLPQEKKTAVPCVVLCQGFCGTKDIVLENYALRYVEAGFAVLAFDFRHFGSSEGKPRQLYSIVKQLEDIKGAVEFARNRYEIDQDKIVIWGTSSAGNYGVLLAADDPKIAGIIGQCPSLDPQEDGKKTVKRDGMKWLLKLLLHASRDKGRSRLGLSSHTFPTVGKPGSIAMLIAPGAFEGYQKLAKNSLTFKNEVCARLFFESHGPDLFKSAEKVECPVLFHICEKDNINSPDSYQKIKKILDRKVEIVKYPVGHFGLYSDEYFEKSVNNQIAFLKKLINRN